MCADQRSDGPDEDDVSQGSGSSGSPGGSGSSGSPGGSEDGGSTSRPGLPSRAERDVEVRSGSGAPGDAPEQFLWQGQLHRVHAVLGHRSGVYEVWRVQAAAGQRGRLSVFVLRLDWSTGRWSVDRVAEGEEDR